MEWVIWMAPGIRKVTGGETGLQMRIDTAMGRAVFTAVCAGMLVKKEEVRMIEDPTFEQEQILAVFDHKIDGGVSQRLKA